MDFSESMKKVLLAVVESGIVLGSSGVVLLTNTVHSVFLLGFVFILISLPYLILNADFVAAAQVSIYVGAVNVSIAFAVMSTRNSQDENFYSPRTVGDSIILSICTILFFLLIIMILDTSWSDIYRIERSNEIMEQSALSSVRRIGYQLLTYFSLPFELLSVLLLIALVGAIDIARRDTFIEVPDDGASRSEDDFYPF
uniref:NAD(P)H-quinone oxidoreductase subunit 6, chloroplastic n=2 Tax=Ophioglossum TaxID=13833 RepID=L7T157_9MONI|nr:NAD(P)H-quinone oxidoreductase subunit 6 [Ophioglossum californicum]AGC26762.1 NAD(P)H-quinone oxidoreductase subunit 6 [Ophioglossum californicum]QXF60135.1 NADH dehydrogenase subunit 6 [Ophioglossum vulgatum]